MLRPTAHVLTLLALAPTAAAQSLGVAGDCGIARMVFDVSDIAPSGRYALVTADRPGTSQVPGGACAGTQLSLARAGLTLRAFRQADAVGEDVIRPQVPPAVCGNAYAQLLDLTTCTTSNVVLVDTPPALATFTPGDTTTVVTGTGIDGTGDLEFRCGAWAGDICTDVEIRTAAGTCPGYAQDGVWHDTAYVNSPEQRICPLVCMGTTQGVGVDETWSECSAGTAAVYGATRAFGWSSTAGTCTGTDVLWREMVTDQHSPWTLNIRLGDNYAGSPQLRLRCNGWN